MDDRGDAFDGCRQGVGAEDVTLGALHALGDFFSGTDEGTALDARRSESPEQAGADQARSAGDENRHDPFSFL